MFEGIVDKINEFVKLNNLDHLSSGIFPRSLFGIESDFVEKNIDKVMLFTGRKYDVSKYVKLFTNDKSGSGGRTTWFLAEKGIIESNENRISEWQVVVSSAHPGGQARRDSKLGIIDDNSAFGRARLALKSFKTKQEAENFMKYVRSALITFTFFMTDEALSSLALKVPDILEYSDQNKYIDFRQDIDSQLFKLFDLNDEQAQYVINRVTELQ